MKNVLKVLLATTIVISSITTVFAGKGEEGQVAPGQESCGAVSNKKVKASDAPASSSSEGEVQSSDA